MIFTVLKIVPGHALYILHIAALFCIAYQLYKIRKTIKQDTMQ